MFKTSFLNVDMVINHRILYNSIGVQALMKKKKCNPESIPTTHRILHVDQRRESI